jgi:hypothetical protein
MATPTVTPGDRCRLGKVDGIFVVTHANDCPDHPEGTRTNGMTGEVLE